MGMRMKMKMKMTVEGSLVLMIIQLHTHYPFLQQVDESYAVGKLGTHGNAQTRLQQ